MLKKEFNLIAVTPRFIKDDSKCFSTWVIHGMASMVKSIEIPHSGFTDGLAKMLLPAAAYNPNRSMFQRKLCASMEGYPKTDGF